MAEVPLSEPDVSAHVVLSLSFDYNVALSKFLVFGREVEAVVSNGNARTEEVKQVRLHSQTVRPPFVLPWLHLSQELYLQVSADACEKSEKVIGPKRKHADDEGTEVPRTLESCLNACLVYVSQFHVRSHFLCASWQGRWNE